MAAITWLTMLKHVTRLTSEPVTEDKLAAYAGLLADEFGPEAFTKASLHLVAEQQEFFPAYATLRPLLAGYLTSQRTIPPPASDAMHALLEARQAQEQRDAEVRTDWADPFKVRESAAKIGDDHPMRERLGRMLAALVKRHAPQNLGLLRPEWLEQGAVGRLPNHQ